MLLIGALRVPNSLLAKADALRPPDLVHDELVGGPCLRILNVVDDVTCECLAAIADTSLLGLARGPRAYRPWFAFVAARM